MERNKWGVSTMELVPYLKGVISRMRLLIGRSQSGDAEKAIASFPYSDEGNGSFANSTL